MSRNSLVLTMVLVVLGLSVGGVTYMWLQAQAVSGIQDFFRVITGLAPVPKDPQVEKENAIIRRRFDRLPPTAPLHDWLILLNEDRHGAVADASQSAIRARPALAAELDALLESKSVSDRALALRWLSLRPDLDARVANRAHAALRDLTQRVAVGGRSAPNELELFAGAMACQSLQEAGLAEATLLRQLRNEVERLGEPARLGYIVGTIDFALEHLREPTPDSKVPSAHP